MERKGSRKLQGRSCQGLLKAIVFLSARRSIPGSIFGIVTYSSTFKGGSAMNCFFPPLAWRWLCKRPGSVFVQNPLNPRFAEPRSSSAY